MQVKARRQALLLRGLALILWGAVIFWFSSQPGAGDAWQASWGYIIERKSAHVFEYAVFFFFTFRFFWIVFRLETFLRILAFCWVLSLAYGASDELHQFFVPGRGAHLLDVLVDGFGASLSALFLWVTWRRRNAIMKRRK